MKIEVDDDLIPQGAELIEAYHTDKNEIIVLGNPDWVANHDCDQMGCSTFSHVVLREKVKP